jgi:phenylacetic acid degradation operon negative regulatory protein
VVLNLVRVTPQQRSVPIRRLLSLGALFGFNANAMRVAVTRLTAESLLESDERGSYRLGPAAAAIHAHVEEWRRGEARMRPWQGQWLAVLLPGKTHRGERRGTMRALPRLGLREGLPGLWVRPDNLRLSLADTVERLRALGLEHGAEPFVARDFSERLTTRFVRALWPLRNLQRGHERALAALERSLAQLPTMPRDRALVQSFVLGGEAIRVLATDPLLPEAILPGETRKRLGEVMLRYDAVGRRLWGTLADGPELSTEDAAPALRAAASGRTASVLRAGASDRRASTLRAGASSATGAERAG